MHTHERAHTLMNTHIPRRNKCLDVGCRGAKQLLYLLRKQKCVFSWDPHPFQQMSPGQAVSSGRIKRLPEACCSQVPEDAAEARSPPAKQTTYECDYGKACLDFLAPQKESFCSPQKRLTSSQGPRTGHTRCNHHTRHNLVSYTLYVSNLGLDPQD